MCYSLVFSKTKLVNSDIFLSFYKGKNFGQYVCGSVMVRRRITEKRLFGKSVLKKEKKEGEGKRGDGNRLHPQTYRSNSRQSSPIYL